MKTTKRADGNMAVLIHKDEYTERFAIAHGELSKDGSVELIYNQNFGGTPKHNYIFLSLHELKELINILTDYAEKEVK